MSRLLGASALALSITASSFALAGDTSTAEHLFQQGLDAMKRNQFKEACDAFAGSNEADASPGTEMNLALCSEKQNKLATAWGWYRTAAGLAEIRNQKDRAELARTEAAKLEPKLHKLVISVKYPADGLIVTRNGAAVPAAVFGTDVPIDPGEYAIEVSAKGKVTWKQTVHINVGAGVDRVEVPALVDAPVEAKPAGGTPGADYTPPAPGGPDGTKQRTVGFILGGAGIVSGIAAISFEFLALLQADKRKTANSALSDAKALPAGPNRVANIASAQSSYDSYDKAVKSDQLIAGITGGVGIVLIGVGITLIVTAPSGSKSAVLKEPRLYPLLGNGTSGLGLSAAF
jgi:hypothetical protein